MVSDLVSFNYDINFGILHIRINFIEEVKDVEPLNRIDVLVSNEDNKLLFIVYVFDMLWYEGKGIINFYHPKTVGKNDSVTDHIILDYEVEINVEVIEVV